MAKDDQDKIREAVERIDSIVSIERDQREKAVEDCLFVDAEDGMWSEDAKTLRADRPRFTVDQISGDLDQIVGDQRQTDIGVDVIPGDGGTKEVADIYDGLIRSIEQLSDAEDTYDQSFSDTLKGGYGGWRIDTEYGKDLTFEQVIKILPIESAASSLYFGPHKKYTAEDAPWGVLIEDIDRREFKHEYPNALEVDFEIERFGWARDFNWVSEESVRVAEFFEKVPHVRNIGMLNDGRVIDLDEEKDVIDELQSAGFEIVKERKVDSYKIMRSIMSAAEVLDGPNEWAGMYIPLIPQYGKTSRVENNKFVRGFVRKAKDPQRIYNYTISNNVEVVALSPKDPIMMTTTEYGKYGLQWKTFNKKNPPIALYTADPANPKGGPYRLGAPSVQEALIQQANQAFQDVQSTLGTRQSASRSLIPKTGEAIDAEQGLNDSRTFVFQNNLQKSIAYTGKILVDLIPRIYDTARVIKVLGPDNNAKDVKINQAIFDRQSGKQVIVNDLSQGDYSVRVRTGPATPTKRKQTVSQLEAIAAKNPIFAELSMDVLVDNLDINESVELKRRVRKYMIEKQIVAPTDEEAKEMGLDKPPEPDPLNVAMVENLQAQTEKLLIQNEKIISEIRNKDADTEQKIMEAQKKSVDAFAAMVEVLLKKRDAGIGLEPTDIDLIEGQEALVLETQEDVIGGQEIAGSLPLHAKEPVGPPPEMPVGGLPEDSPIQEGNTPGVIIPGPLEV